MLWPIKVVKMSFTYLRLRNKICHNYNTLEACQKVHKTDF